MKRFRAGWLIPQQLLALTHFDPIVTLEDFAQIAQDTNTALEQANGNFHLIIDNRIIDETNLATLDAMLQFMPQLNHPNLRWIVMIVPDALTKAGATIVESMPTQHHAQICLKHVDTLPAATQFLQSVDESIRWNHIDKRFFTN